jgi:hypothetical protein
MSLNLLKFSTIVFTLLILGLVSANGQTKCNLKIDVYEFKEDGSAEQFPVTEAKIVLRHERLSITIRNKNGEFIATDLVEGDYDLTVSKKNFKKTENKIPINCGAAYFQNTINHIAFLWEGSSKETKKMFSGAMGQKSGRSKKSSGGEISEGAITLGRPRYPTAARLARAHGKVEVEVLINELGYVVSAEAISGNPLLFSTSVQAARESKFKMTTLEGIPVKVKGIISFIFN